MPILLDKKCFDVQEIRGGHVKISDPTNQTLFLSWYEFYLWLYKKHCILCGDVGTELHHIIPKSHGKASLSWKNMILICNSCHEKIHRNGINETIIVKLQKKRAEVLRAYDRKGFII